jgi:hypothetical protein
MAAGNKVCGIRNGETTCTNLGAKPYFIRILFGSIRGRNKILGRNLQMEQTKL